MSVDSQGSLNRPGQDNHHHPARSNGGSAPLEDALARVHLNEPQQNGAVPVQNNVWRARQQSQQQRQADLLRRAEAHQALASLKAATAARSSNSNNDAKIGNAQLLSLYSTSSSIWQAPPPERPAVVTSQEDWPAISASSQLPASAASAKASSSSSTLSTSASPGVGASQVDQHARQRYLAMRHQYSLPQHGFTGQLHHHLMHDLLPSVVPVPSEVALLEVGRRILESHIQGVCPGAVLVPFGSLVNNLGLRHSDLDLCLVLAKPEEANERTPREILEQIGKILRKRLPQLYVQYKTRARIPIIKIYARYQTPSNNNPWNRFVSDISVGNTLAIHNTRLLKAYTVVDDRYRFLVLFLKIWASRRKINEAYHGTLSSYGWSLMAAYFCMHVLKPPILPNLQQMEKPEKTRDEDVVDGYDTYFFDDASRLSDHFVPSNPSSLGMMILDFLDFYTGGFDWDGGVISLRGESVMKAEKGWHEDKDRDHNYLCIEDPFKTDYNIGRVVREEGYNLIRDELDRARDILRDGERTHQPISGVLTMLLQERRDGPIMHSTSTPDTFDLPVLQRPNVYYQQQQQQHHHYHHHQRGGNKGMRMTHRATAAPIMTIRRTHADDFPPLGSA